MLLAATTKTHPSFNTMKTKPTIGITWGDQAGIGPEIIDAVLKSPFLPDNVDWKMMGLRRSDIIAGHPTEQSALAAWDSLKLAAEGLINGTLSAVVTAPVSKSALQKVGYPWAGQTEFFAEQLGTKNYAMCLSGRHLTVGLTTIHESIAHVPILLNQEEIIRVGRLLAQFCRKRGISTPKIAVAGLNPHAGEGGLFGNEESTIIAPAVAVLQECGENALFSGPHVPDALFREAYLGHYDAIVCMYHDQGLIPLKMVDFDSAINITLGLPCLRVSPDHGTAFDIAGLGIANPSSMLHACQLAAQLVIDTQ